MDIEPVVCVTPEVIDAKPRVINVEAFNEPQQRTLTPNSAQKQTARIMDYSIVPVSRNANETKKTNNTVFVPPEVINAKQRGLNSNETRQRKKQAPNSTHKQTGWDYSIVPVTRHVNTSSKETADPVPLDKTHQGMSVNQHQYGSPGASPQQNGGRQTSTVPCTSHAKPQAGMNRLIISEIVPVINITPAGNSSQTGSDSTSRSVGGTTSPTQTIQRVRMIAISSESSTM